MAGDWIKFEMATPDKPEVWQIAALLNIDPDAVVGKLLRVWAWFDQHTDSGNAPSVTTSLLDRLVGVTGFCQAVISVGWMSSDAEGVALPNFERHNGQTSKQRALTRKRVERHRVDRHTKFNGDSVTESLPEKRREEKNNPNGLSPLYVPPDPAAEKEITKCPAQQIVEDWNRMWGKSIRLTAKRRKALVARWSDPWWRDNWQKALRKARELPFCNGDNDRDWQATLDWFAGPDTVTRILEGFYDGSSNSGSDPERRKLERNRANLAEFVRRSHGSTSAHETPIITQPRSNGTVVAGTFRLLGENSRGGGSSGDDQ